MSDGYAGQIFRIPLGTRGQMVDVPQTRAPIDALLEATNVSFYRGILATDTCAQRWNSTALGSPVVALSDFWPDDDTQRVHALTADGVLHRFIDLRQSAPVTGGTITLTAKQPPCFVTGGAESGNARKLFMFTGSTQVQVMAGDSATRADMAKPALDWASGAFPTAGCIHAGRLVAWGNKNLPHMLYLSAATNHEDFQDLSAALFFPIFPGEGERILGCYNFKGRLFICKFPYGVYYLDDSSPTLTDWSIKKLAGNFGVASAFSFVEGLDDLFVANSQGSITQMSATLNFGSIQSGNLLRNLGCESYMRSTTARFGYTQRYGVWYEDKKQAWFTYQSAGGTSNDLMLIVDFNDPELPKVSWNTRDKPACLALVKDTLGMLRPMYGSKDGYLYRTDLNRFAFYNSDNLVTSTYKSSFKTINHDFGGHAPGMAETEKLFDFVELTFIETGAWNINIDVYIDNYFSERVQIPLNKKRFLGATFALDGTTPLEGPGSQSFRVPIHGKGRRIAFKCSSDGQQGGQPFAVTELAVYFMPAGQDQEA